MRISKITATGSLVMLLAGAGFSQPASAEYSITLTEQGGNVVASGSGTIDLTDLTFDAGGSLAPANLAAALGYINTGVTGAALDFYAGFTGPTSYGSGGPVTASSSSGDAVGIAGSSTLYGEPLFWVPNGYVSGSSLSDSATYAGETLASLGATPGTYVWTWGSGAHADSFVLNVGNPIPEPTSVALLASALLGFAAVRRAARK